MTDRHRRILASLVAEIHRAGRTCLVDVAGRPQRARPVVGDGPEHPGLASRNRGSCVSRTRRRAASRPTPDTGCTWTLLLESRRKARPMRGRRGRLRRVARSATCSSMRRRSSRGRRSRSASRSDRPTRPSASSTSTSWCSRASRVLVIVVGTGGHVIAQVIETDEPYDATALTQAANYINSEFAGLTLHEARDAIVERLLREERQLYDALMKRALDTGSAGARTRRAGRTPPRAGRVVPDREWPGGRRRPAATWSRRCACCSG